MDNKERFSYGQGNAGSDGPQHNFLDAAQHFLQSMVSDLVRDALKDMADRLPEIIESQLMMARDEARLELKEAGRKVIHAATPLGIGIGFAIFAAGFFLLAVAHGLALVMPAWVAALIVAFAAGIAALALINVGNDRFKTMHFNTDRPIEKISQNVKANVTEFRNAH